MESTFVADAIGVSFGTRVVLKAASVWARPGEVTALLGRNGCGKSTLFRAALGMVRPDFGTVRFFGKVHLRPRLARLSPEGLFYLPDQGLLSRRQTLGWHLTVLGERYPKDGREEIPDALAVRELLSKTVWEMSGGEERRAEVALAWARRPRCLLADEPLAGLAPLDQELVGGVIRTMADGGCAVVVTGHDVRPLLEISDQVVWMVSGTTHGLGSPDEARAHDQFRREYLGPAF